MILGYDGFDYSPFLDNCFLGSKQNEIQLSNMVIDEIKMDESLDIPNTIDKKDWGIETSLHAKFQNNIEGGNLTNQGIPIQKIRIKKRKVGELKWEVMIDFSFSLDKENYDVEDYYVETATNYEYSLVPVTQSIEGVGLSNFIYVDYSSLFLTSDSENYAFRYNADYGTINQVKDEKIIQTLSSKFPMLIRGLCDYETGSVKALPLSDGTIKNNSINIDEQKTLHNKLYTFLHSGKPLLLRYFNMYYLVSISDVSRTPDSVGNYGIEEIQFTWTQIADTDLETLEANGLTYQTRSNQS